MQRAEFIIAVSGNVLLGFLHRTGLFLFLTLCMHREVSTMVLGTLSLTELWSSLCRIDGLGSEPQQPSCLCFPNAGIISVFPPHVQLFT